MEAECFKNNKMNISGKMCTRRSKNDCTQRNKRECTQTNKRVVHTKTKMNIHSREIEVNALRQIKRLYTDK